MKKRISLLLIPIAFIITLTFNSALAQLIAPKAQSTPSGGPTIEQAQKEDYMGPKARVAVTKFVDKSAKGYGRIGDGMAEMLANSLFATNRFIVLERQSLSDVIAEQDLGASGRVRQETAARIGEIEGADILIEGTITEFEPGSSGAGGGLGGLLPGKVGAIAGIFGGIKKSHVALIVKMIDTRTGRRIASEQIEGTATDIEGMAGFQGTRLSGAFSGFSNTPMEKAIRIAIDEAVRVIISKTPSEYYRASSTTQTTSPPPTTVSPQSFAPPMVTSTPSAPAPISTSEPRIVYILWPKVSLREGPGTNFKPLGEITKGTPVAVLEEKGSWIHVRLEDGQEGWIGKATASETPLK